MKKIFGIGLARTGTTTLAKALEILGYKSVHVECNVMEVSTFDDSTVFSVNRDIVQDNDCVVGTPLSPCYEMLAKEYPESLFILTVRDNKTWLNSCSLGFTEKMIMDDNHKALHKWLYDSRLYDKDKFLAGYTNFVLNVLTFFGRFKERLLVYNICSGVGWKPLCDFLKKPIPECTLPHESKRRIITKSSEDGELINKCPYCSKHDMIWLKKIDEPKGNLYRCYHCKKKLFFND